MPTATPTATMIRFMLPSYFTLPRVRMPAAATDPNSTMPAPPRTGGGITATTPPTTGSRPRTTRITPAATTTNRDFTRVMATRPTFWAKADWVKELNTGETAEESMSARSPAAIRLESTFVSTISPTARMSAVVSTMVTRMTTNMETIAPIAKVGIPKKNGVGNATTPASAIPEKSTFPNGRATIVPTTMPSRMDIREIIPTPTLDRISTIASVIAARTMLLIEPYSGVPAIPAPPGGHPHQGQADDRDHRAGDHRWEEPDDLGEERGDHQADERGGDHRTEHRLQLRLR